MFVLKTVAIQKAEAVGSSRQVGSNVGRMADSEAPPIVSPEKRRRGPMPVLPAKTPTIVGSVDGVQQSAAGAVVTFMAYLLAVGTPRMVKVRGAEKHVVSVAWLLWLKLYVV